MSCKAQARGKFLYSENGIEVWASAVKAARKELGLTGFVPIGGTSASGQALLARARDLRGRMTITRVFTACSGRDYKIVVLDSDSEADVKRKIAAVLDVDPSRQHLRRISQGWDLEVVTKLSVTTVSGRQFTVELDAFDSSDMLCRMIARVLDTDRDISLLAGTKPLPYGQTLHVFGIRPDTIVTAVLR